MKKGRETSDVEELEQGRPDRPASTRGPMEPLAPERFKEIFELAPEAMVIVRRETATILDLNLAAEKLLAVTREEMTGRPVTDFAPPEGWATAAWGKKQLDQHGHFEQRGAPFRRGDGAIFRADVSASRLKLLEAEVTLIALRDGTDRLTQEEEAKRRNEELQFLYDMGKVAGRSTDIQILLEHTLDAVLAQLELEVGGIYLLDEKKEHLLLAASHGMGPDLVLEMGRIPRGRGLTWVMVESGEPLLVDNPSQDPRTFSKALKRYNLRYYCGAPLFFGARVLGAIVVATAGDKKLDRSTADFLYAIGCQVGTAIGKAVREETLRQSEALYRGLFEMAQEPTLLIDIRVLDIVAANGAAERLTGYRREELRGKPLAEMVSPVQSAGGDGFAGMLEHLESKPAVSRPGKLFPSGGKPVPVDITLRKVDLRGRDFAVCRLSPI